MAEAAGLAASILAIAGAGISITTTLYRFTKSYQSTDRKVEGIVTTVSVTSSILTELGNAIKEHPDDLQKLNRWALFSDTIAGCKKDFEIIGIAIGEARKGGATMQDQQKVRKDAKARATPRQKLKWAIGGETEIENLLSSLERSKSNLQLLLDASNYDTLRKLEKSHALNPQLVEQLAEIRAILPWLVTNMSKLGYRTGREDGPDKHLGGPQEISLGEQKAPPDFDSSEPPSQEVKDGQKGSHHRDNFLSAKSNPDDGEDVPLPPNVQESLPPQAVSREPVREVIQEPSYEHANHSTGETLSPAVLLSRNPSPAAASKRFDSAKYEAWLLTYRKAHIKRDKRYQETVVITRPFTRTVNWVELIPASYHLARFYPPESELEAAVLEKGATPVIEVIASLPLAAREAVESLVKLNSVRSPSIAKLNILKESLWGRLIGRRKSWPSLIVFLECRSNEILLRRHTYVDHGCEIPPSPNVPRERGRGRGCGSPSFQRRPTEGRPSGGDCMRRRVPVTACPSISPTRIHSNRTIHLERRRPYSEGTYSEVEEDAVEKRMEDYIPSREWRFVEKVHNEVNDLREPMSRSPSKASNASVKQALPSEQEAERIMEEFLSKLTTSQGSEDRTRQDDAIAATAPAASNEAEQESWR